VAITAPFHRPVDRPSSDLATMLRPTLWFSRPADHVKIARLLLPCWICSSRGALNSITVRNEDEPLGALNEGSSACLHTEPWLEAGRACQHARRLQRGLRLCCNAPVRSHAQSGLPDAALATRLLSATLAD